MSGYASTRGCMATTQTLSFEFVFVVCFALLVRSGCNSLVRSLANSGGKSTATPNSLPFLSFFALSRTWSRSAKSRKHTNTGALAVSFPLILCHAAK